MTIKQRKWVKYYIETGNATEAALRVYKCKSRKVASQIGYENMRKPDVLAVMEQSFEAGALTPVYFAKTLKRVIDSGLEGKATCADALRGIDIYAKITGLYEIHRFDDTNEAQLEEMNYEELVSNIRERHKRTALLLQDL